MKASRLVAGATLAIVAWILPAQAEERRGPFEARESFLPAQPRLNLPVVSPDPIGRGHSTLRLDLDWGNDFSRRVGSYFIDGEHRSAAVTFRRGIAESWSVGARLPILWRGGGFLDRFADAIHKLGFPNNGRPEFPRDRLRITADEAAGKAVRWTGVAGSGIGKLELESSLTPWRRAERRLAVGFSARVALPTTSGAFSSADGVEAGLQALAARGLGDRFDVYAGIGLALQAPREQDGFQYAPRRAFGHLAFEWRFARGWSALAQADAGGRLLEDVERYPGLQSYLRLGVKRALGARTTLEAGFSENIKSQQATTDFGILLGVVRRF